MNTGAPPTPGRGHRGQATVVALPALFGLSQRILHRPPLHRRLCPSPRKFLLTPYAARASNSQTSHRPWDASPPPAPLLSPQA
ncbi:UNVERIFIED_CONTAM: hypothetical protein Sradi_5523800 [Sesamum radiatum]|uniref:Uncharacterized protein n=1 Tax=Sesamum radiatum TaxID=300843 RepID=A0AAW2LBQ3_SESRA